MSAASIFGVAGMLSMVGIVTSGWLSDRVGYRFAATLSFVLTLAGTACLAAISFSSLVLFPIGFVLLFGVAQGARGPIISTLSNRFFAGASAATVFGILYLAMSIGAALGS
ncbi:MAG: MFS transporter [Burkholderiaceae bacterium]